MNARTSKFACGEQMKRGRRFSVQLRDEPFEWLRQQAVKNQRSVSQEAALIIEAKRHWHKYRAKERENERVQPE